jgi:hypothetical protein
MSGMTRSAAGLILFGCVSHDAEPATTPSVVVDLPASPDLPTSATSSAPGPGLALDELTGRYFQAHEVQHVCDSPDWCVAEVEDSLVLESRGARVSARIELVQTNYHLCTWEGELVRGGDGKSWESVQPECTVSLRLEERALELTSEGCREHCGARAHLIASFPRDSRSPVP